MKYVRVRDENGAEVSIPERKLALRPDRYDQLKDEEGNPLPATDRGGNPLDPVEPTKQSAGEALAAQQPAKSAKHEVWVAYASGDSTPDGLRLSEEQATAMSRNELVAHFNQES